MARPADRSEEAAVRAKILEQALIKYRAQLSRSGIENKQKFGGAQNTNLKSNQQQQIMNIFEKALNDFSEEIQTRSSKTIEDGLKKVATALAKAEKIDAIAKAIKPIEIIIDSKPVGKIDGLKHIQLEHLIRLVAVSEAVLMVGMAGTGKTKAAQQVAEALNLPFFAISVGAQTSKSDIMGYMSANGNYVKTSFRDAFEHGGVFLMDEIDAGNANVLIQINSALSNGLCGFPDKMVEKHKDFKFIGTANTFGTGADRMYVGRNVLDAATLDRFTTYEWKVDENLEASMVQNYKQGGEWHRVIKAVRKWTIDNKIPALITPRATLKGAKLLEVGFNKAEVFRICIEASYPKDKVESIKKLV